ncbi:hypothetical protein OIU74_003920 [Salix koriyanagi]|uniref:Uncharacterized protein n=1 Tax=Salix koriyanagi TaxID=2511006 RepID=A0A9Q0UZQ2_9ROSI|nr:hypothetical protein OIU74_003920 [Salix koriyanagi]
MTGTRLDPSPLLGDVAGILFGDEFPDGPRDRGGGGELRDFDDDGGGGGDQMLLPLSIFVGGGGGELFSLEEEGGGGEESRVFLAVVRTSYDQAVAWTLSAVVVVKRPVLGAGKRIEVVMTPMAAAIALLMKEVAQMVVVVERVEIARARRKTW